MNSAWQFLGGHGHRVRLIEDWLNAPDKAAAPVSSPAQLIVIAKVVRENRERQAFLSYA